MTADQAAQMLVRMMEDTEVPFGVRAKIAQDLLDRAGLIARQVHQIIPMTEEPSHAVLRGHLQRPGQLGVHQAADPTPAIESSPDHHDAEPDESIEREIAEPEGEPANDTPPRIAEMIKAGAFDRKPSQ